MPKHNDMEHQALQVVVNSGTQGILQCDLWRRLDASSREGSRIALKLERKGLIRRERELYDGRWTYRLYATRQPITIDSIIDIPCLACTDNIRCGVGSAISPVGCEKLNKWLRSMIGEKNNPDGGT